jgi:mRNA deadenylase 3'-5' endonuclease subunit Ccr4
MIVRHVQALNPCILTIQEAEDSTTPEGKDFASKMASLGLLGVTKAKKRDGADACAIFWNGKRFQLIADPLGVEYSDFPDCVTDIQVGLAVALREVTSGNIVIVATTHLSAAKLAEDQRCFQMTALLKAVSVWVAEKNFATDCVIFTGDFNTSRRWGLIPKILQGTLLPPEDRSLNPILMGPMHSPYVDHATALFEDRKLTVYMPHKQDIVDYVFYPRLVGPCEPTRVHLHATSALKVPGERQLFEQSVREAGRMKFNQLPTPSFPSDHIPLVIEFQFLQ